MTRPRAFRSHGWRSAGLAVALAASCLGSSACREQAPQGTGPKFPPCTEVGQRCEFSPGKLGACVQRDGCQEKNCFICQSQH